MRTSYQVQRRAVVIWVIGLVLGVSGAAAVVKTSTAYAASGNAASGKRKEKGDATASSKGSAPPGVTLNACGCYRSGDTCMCTNKNARCECPGDCEPVACEEKRQKEMDREVAAEVKRAEDEDKKRQAAEAESQRKAAEAEAARVKAEEGGDEAGDDSAASDDKAAPPSAEKADKAEDKAADKGADKAPAKPAQKPVHKGRAAHKPARSGG